ncbi:MAG: zf-HC2 domain-containing protein [Deltaproteobacteria bacterium]|nr:MAG: zf-HC2 domain-containing protein [Deltaproteobacteria bacterium]
MTSCARVVDCLDAYHDGELAGLMRRRVERHLEHCSSCRREIAAASALGELLRESADAVMSPDLWSQIEPRLAPVDAASGVAPARSAPAVSWDRLRGLVRPLPWLVRPVAAAAAVALIVLVYWTGVGPEEAAGEGVVRWLDSYGNPVMLLEQPDATIIWLVDPVLDDVSMGGGFRRGVI